MPPGDDAGDCYRCGETMVQIGWESAVVAAHCEGCTFTVSLSGDAMALPEARDTDWSDWEPLGTPGWGPDPNP